MDDFCLPRFGGNVLEAFIFVASRVPRQAGCVAVLFHCGDPFLVEVICNLSRRFEQFSRILCPQCGGTHRCREPPPWVFSTFYPIGWRVRNFSTCRVCHMEARNNAYESALHEVNMLSEFRRQGFLAPGFCCRCQRVQHYQLHCYYACFALTPGEPLSPLVVDCDSGSSRGS